MASIRAREWLIKNKIWFETAAAALLSLMAIVVSGAQLFVMQQQSLVAEKQYQTSIEPLIVIELEDELGLGKNGVYKLKIVNS